MDGTWFTPRIKAILPEELTRHIMAIIVGMGMAVDGIMLPIGCPFLNPQRR
jgi:hypothetical protein